MFWTVFASVIFESNVLVLTDLFINNKNIAPGTLSTPSRVLFVDDLLKKLGGFAGKTLCGTLLPK
jgi:hypothetical protein